MDKQITRIFSLTALLLFIPANFYPIIIISKLGREEYASLLDLVLRVADNSLIVALVIAFCLFVAPYFTLFSLVLNSFLGRFLPKFILEKVLAAHRYLRHWSMIEVFILAVFASMIKLNELVETEIGYGTYFYAAFWIALFVADKHFYIEEPKELIKNSEQRAFAFSVAALAMLIPANIFVIMKATKLGVVKESDLWHSIQQMFEGPAWPIGVVLFIASFLSPWFKIFSIWYLSLTAKTGKNVEFKEVLYKILETVGKWAMIDIFVVAILVAVVRLDALANVSIQLGGLVFTLMVLFTILASSSFDHRLLRVNYKRLES